MSETVMREEIRSYLQTNFIFDERQQLGDAQSLLQTGVLDSTGILELIGWLETRYGISFKDSDLVADNFDTVDRIVKFLAQRTGNNETHAGT